MFDLVRLLFGGGDRVPVCGDCFVCVRCACVCVIEASYEPPKLGGIGLV